MKVLFQLRHPASQSMSLPAMWGCLLVGEHTFLTEDEGIRSHGRHKTKALGKPWIKRLNLSFPHWTQEKKKKKSYSRFRFMIPSNFLLWSHFFRPYKIPPGECRPGVLNAEQPWNSRDPRWRCSAGEAACEVAGRSSERRLGLLLSQNV